MIINFEDHPNKSILYLGSEILKYVKVFNSRSINDLLNFFVGKGYNYNLIYVALDYLFYLGIIKDLNDLGEIIL